MSQHLAHGHELLEFYIDHGYVKVTDELGQAIICPRQDIDTLNMVINIPYAQDIGHELLKYLLERGNFTTDEFWQSVTHQYETTSYNKDSQT